MNRIAQLLLLSGLLSVLSTQAAPRLQPDLDSLAAVPHFSVAGAQAARALTAAAPERSGEPPHFAAGVVLPLQLADGRWERLDAQTWSWRVRIGSPGARLLNFRFDQFHLPPSGKLYVYTDWSYRSGINFFLYESKEFDGPSLAQAGLKLGYTWADGKYDAAVFCRNCTNQIRTIGGIDFADLLGYINDPRIIGAQIRVKF